MSCSNLSAPFTFRISSTNASANPGIQFNIGTPPQAITLQPSLTENDDGIVVNTGPGVCYALASDLCVPLAGGLYNPNVSSTAQIAPLSSPLSSTVFVNDTLRYGSTVLTDAQVTYIGPINYFVDPGRPPLLDVQPGTLPISNISPFLQQIVADQLAPSRSFGVYWGSSWGRDKYDGSLTVGGYDSALIDGPLYDLSSMEGEDAYDSNDGCLNITSIAWTDYLSNQTSELLPQGIFQATCLRTELPGIWLPGVVYDGFINATNLQYASQEMDGTPLTDGTYHYWDQNSRYNLAIPSSADIPNGALSMTITGNITVTIPSTQIWDRIPSYAQPLFPNMSSETFVAQIFDAGGPLDENYGSTNALLGSLFLSYLYLVRDFEHNVTSIANVVSNPNATTPDLTRICPVVAKTTSHVSASSLGATHTPKTTLLSIICVIWLYAYCV